MLTHAVFDTLTGDQVGEGYPDVFSAMKAAAELGGIPQGYAAGLIKWKAPKVEEKAEEKPAEIVKEREKKDQGEPGLFDF
jgi:hypothetical protein